MHDTIITSGRVYDGSGSAAKEMEIGISDGVITELADKITTKARHKISAEGAIVTPAWVDIHTHYDGQVTWDSAMEPSASHGVGTVVMGNCGVGFAPVPPGGEKDLIELMEGVEDIPGTSLYEGMPWGSWESYAEYLQLLAKRQYALNISSMVSHGPVRNYVMGERGRANEPATADDLSKMVALVEEAVRAGAVGFSTSRILGHRSITGAPVPGTYAADEELYALTSALGNAKKGVFQLIPSSTLGPGHPGFEEHSSLEGEIRLIGNASRKNKRPCTFTLFQVDAWADKWREVLALVKQENTKGAQIYPQVGSRPTGLVLSMATYHRWMVKPAYRRLRHLPLEERLRELRKPEIKAQILSEPNDTSGIPIGSMEFGIANFEPNPEYLFKLFSDSTYEPKREESFAALAKEASQEPLEMFYDYLVADHRNRAILFFTNYSDYNLDSIREMQLDESTVTGLSDAGAHVSLIFDAVNPTYQLTYWTRDRTRGATLPLEHVIHRATRRNANLFGFKDRGLIAEGMKADINVIDYEQLALGELTLKHDLPSGGARLMQNAIGYRATLINGVATRLQDEDTGERPGKLIRS